MKFRSDHSSRLASGKNLYFELSKRNEKIARDLELLLRDYESFDTSICKDSLGRELNIANALKLKDTKLSLASALHTLKKLISNKNKASYTFDSLRSMIEQDIEG